MRSNMIKYTQKIDSLVFGKSAQISAKIHYIYIKIEKKNQSQKIVKKDSKKDC